MYSTFLKIIIRRRDMAENITPEEYKAEIAMLNHEIYELQKQLEQNNAEKAESLLIDKYNPFDNPTDYPDYSGDYTEIIPQAAIPGCKIPVEPGGSEKKRLRKFYTIGGTSILCHFAFSIILSLALFSLIMLILQFKNPDLPYDTLYDYASSSSILIAISAVIYLAANVGFSLMGLKWAKISPSSLIKTRNFNLSLAVQYCFSAIFIQYAASLLSAGASNIIEKYGFNADTVNDPGFASSSSGFIIMIIYSCIIAPITEEFFFRGMLLKTFSRANQRFAIVATAIFFGLTHGNLPQFILAFLLGIFLAHMTLKHNSILPSIITHMFVNTSATVMNFLSGKYDSQTALGILKLIYILMALVGLLMLIEFSIKNKLPRTTPQQSRRGFAIAKTSIPTVLAFFIQVANIVVTVVS